MSVRRPKFEVIQNYNPEGRRQWYWHLRASNGEIVAQSEGYTRKADAERGARDARRAARYSAIGDG